MSMSKAIGSPAEEILGIGLIQERKPKRRFAMFEAVVLGILFLLVAVWTVFPVLWMIGASLKTNVAISNDPLSLWPARPTLEHYRYVWTQVPFARYIVNTFWISLIVTVAKLVTSVLAAYAFSFYRFRGRDVLFYALLLTAFVPFTATMIPNYLIVAHLGLLSSVLGVALPQLADGLGIFLLRQAFRSVPLSFYEAALMERIGTLRILWYVLLPLVRPSLVALTILFFINTWNEYFWPFLILKEKSSYTLPIALQMFTNLEGGINWGAMMAASTLTSLLPLLAYALAQRQIMETFLHSGVKG
ncbi:carbohydrate ABC transporter permease [Brockia lithotrophica]|uniref:Carbohydrate ABC transporter membrane protein 2 (CUT1 family) n=1 Tax=Brockia lithotrophica TaxID=933949 RepID=A0A660KWM8_9BACL|nr:carbohydrate ABC transporter permease [Brockia lithotrophica]RKQ84701.1 carbohydrate ABC transporter membrane protein 2 (CUT1 family) [Brockia lithotrophica]